MSILSAVIDNFITKEDINITLCDRVYKKFGFTCRPIILNEKQKVVANLWNLLNQTKEYKKWLAYPLTQIILNKKAKMSIRPRVYDFSEQDIDCNYTYPYPKRSDLPNLTDEEIIEEMIVGYRQRETKEETIKAVYNSYVNSYNFYIKAEIDEAKREPDYPFNISLYRSYKKETVKRKMEILDELGQITQKGEQNTIEGTIKRLEARYDALKFTGAKPNKWRILPLSSALERASFPPRDSIIQSSKKARIIDQRYEVDEFVIYSDIITKVLPHTFNIHEIWKDYITQSYGIIKPQKYYKPRESIHTVPEFFFLEVYINLEEIADLPLDLDRIRCSKQQEAR